MNSQMLGERRVSPSYLSAVLKAAGWYNLVWGTAVICFPAAAFRMFDMQLPLYPEIWQCVGMIVGVYGVGYLVASRDPARHWPIVLVGLLGKVLGPIGFLQAASAGTLPWSWGLLILFNDLIWLVPFAQTLYYAWKQNSNTGIGRPMGIEDATLLFPSQNGSLLAELSQDQKVMVVFLRHFGCTFCQEALTDLGENRSEIERLGFRIALVHMSPSKEADAVLKHRGLADIDHYSDPACEIYRAFGLQRGTANQLFGPKVVWRGIRATLQGHRLGPLAGDGFRMPGVYFLYQSEIWGSYRHQTAADRPDYLALCQRAAGILDEAPSSSQQIA